MKEKKKRNEYRILAIAAVFFVTGLVFFMMDRAAGPKAPQPAKTVTIEPAGNGAPSQLSASPLAGMPAPANFRTFTFKNGEIDGSSTFVVTSTCEDAYVAILVFPSAVDYRTDVTRAVYNRAFPCAGSGDVVSAAIKANAGMLHSPTGTYYYFTADQGTSSMWYNPK